MYLYSYMLITSFSNGQKVKLTFVVISETLLVAQMGKNLLQYRRPEFNSWVGKIPWRREWQPTPVFLPGESQGRGSLVGCRLRYHTELDTTEAT